MNNCLKLFQFLIQFFFSTCFAVLYLLAAQGWKRDLTLEGIEPNTGPITWGDIEKLVKDRIGGDFNPEVHQQVLDELKNDVRAHCQLNPVAIINSDHVLKYLNEKEPSHPFSDLIQGVVSTLTKSGKPLFLS